MTLALLFRASAWSVPICLVLFAACASAHRSDATGAPGGSLGSFDGSFLDKTGSGGRFRLLLYAEQPDRLHAELLPPVGGPRLILDGGAGRIAVSVVPDRVAYVGDAEAESLARVIGARISLEQLVGSLLGTGSHAGDGWTIRRDPPEGAGLPERFEIHAADRVITLRRSGRERSARGRSALGTGEPPPGFSVLPLSELPIEPGATLLEREAGS